MGKLCALVAVLASCNPVLECGEGTIERNGQCVSSGIPNDTGCGAGTYRDPVSGQCMNGLIDGSTGVCGPYTERVVNDAGVAICVGTGGGGCDVPRACPTPSDAAHFSICGRLWNLDTGTPLDDGDAGNGEPFRDVEVRIYEPFDFLAGGPDSPAITTASVDECGRFAIPDVSADLLYFGLVALGSDDATATGQDAYGLVGTVAPFTRGVALRLDTWVARREVDVAWTGDPPPPALGGQSFFTRGVFVPIFYDPKKPPVPPLAGTPVSGVTVLRAGAPVPADDFYFNDVDPAVRTSVDTAGTLTSTGANGTSLVINSPGLTGYQGSGGDLSPGCRWMQFDAATIAGVVYALAAPAICD